MSAMNNHSTTSVKCGTLWTAIDKALPVGPRSVLLGAHCWFLHPFFVAAAWWKLYGCPRDPRLWVAFFVHDLGYLVMWCKNMDGEEGERHPEVGAAIMHRLFDKETVEQEEVLFPTSFDDHDGYHDAMVRCGDLAAQGFQMVDPSSGGGWEVWQRRTRSTYWRDLCLYHSRFYARRDNAQVSPLCAADKLGTCLEPWWLYLPRVWATGELSEYMGMMGVKEGSKYHNEPELEVNSFTTLGRVAADDSLPFFLRVVCWHRRMVIYMAQWAHQHSDGRPDTWTPPHPTPKEAAHA